MKTLTMYDAENVHAMPAHTTLALGYVDGRDTSGHFAAVRERFPHALIVAVTVTGAHLDAKVADVERYDLTAEQGAEWARRKVAAGQAPTLYCEASNWRAVRGAVAALKFPPGPRVSYLIAQYDGVARVPYGAIGKQFSTGTFDTSIVAADWPGVLPTPLGRWQRRRIHQLVNGLSQRINPLVSEDARALELIGHQAQRIERI